MLRPSRAWRSRRRVSLSHFLAQGYLPRPNSPTPVPPPSLGVPTALLRCPWEAPYFRIAPRHSRSDVCPGCLIQRLQKYSVGEAATTQPSLSQLLPPPTMFSSPATSFTQFPRFPHSLVFRFALLCGVSSRCSSTLSRRRDAVRRFMLSRISPLIIFDGHAGYPREIDSVLMTTLSLSLSPCSLPRSLSPFPPFATLFLSPTLSLSLLLLSYHFLNYKYKVDDLHVICTLIMGNCSQSV